MWWLVLMGVMMPYGNLNQITTDMVNRGAKVINGRLWVPSLNPQQVYAEGEQNPNTAPDAVPLGILGDWGGGFQSIWTSPSGAQAVPYQGGWLLPEDFTTGTQQIQSGDNDFGSIFRDFVMPSVAAYGMGSGFESLMGGGGSGAAGADLYDDFLTGAMPDSAAQNYLNTSFDDFLTGAMPNSAAQGYLTSPSVPGEFDDFLGGAMYSPTIQNQLNLGALGAGAAGAGLAASAGASGGGAAGGSAAGSAAGAAGGGTLAKALTAMGLDPATASTLGGLAPLLGAGAGALMGGMGGDGPAGTTTTVQDVPDWQKPYVMDLMNRAKTQMDATQGDTTATDLSRLGASGMSSTIRGDFLSPDSNPYLQGTFDKAARSLTDTYNYNVMPQLSRTFGNMQAFGGNSAYNELFDRNNRQLATGLADLGTGIFGGNYQQERGRQLTATMGAPDYASAYTQSPWGNLNQYGNIVGQRFGSQTQQPYFQNKAAGVLGGALTGAMAGRLFQ